MFKTGYSTHRKATTGSFPYTERLIDEGQQSLIEAIGASRDDFQKMIDLGRIARIDYPLFSRHNPEVISDDKLTVVWHEDTPAVIALESRDVHNYVDTAFVYFGARR